MPSEFIHSLENMVTQFLLTPFLTFSLFSKNVIGNANTITEFFTFPVIYTRKT